MKVIVKCIAGSHLFGTQTELSDKDFKGVFIPSADDLLLGRGKDTRTSTTGSNFSKNSAEDIDVELYSLSKFMTMLSGGDTASLELLFTPDHLIIESSSEWELIQNYRTNLISKSIGNIIGYARSQVNKYGVRGSRVGELKVLLPKLKELDKNNPNLKLKVVWEDLIEELKKFEHIKITELDCTTSKDNTKVPAIDILGKKFDHNTQLSFLCKRVSEMYKEYGQRSREASVNKGQDYKAISHAARVMFQAKELLTTGNITLPLKPDNLKVIMDIKLGKLDYKEWTVLLDEMLTEVENLRKVSTLPEKVDQDIVEYLVKKLHLETILEGK